MGSQERIIRQKKETASAIIEAAMDILIQDGQEGISMRRIADKIEYTAPIIYSYYKDKHEVLKELVSIGYIKLNDEIENMLNAEAELSKRVETIMRCMIDFALSNEELYKLMSYMALIEPQSLNQMPEIVHFVETLKVEIRTHSADIVAEETVQERFFTLMAVAHGLISVSYVSPAFINLRAKKSIKDLINCTLA